MSKIRLIAHRQLLQFSSVLVMEDTEIKEDPFPAPTKDAIGLVDGVETHASSTFFTDKIVVTLSQAGRISQWVSIPRISCAEL